MNIHLFGNAFVIGLCFVSWAIVGNRFASGALTGTIVMVVTAIVVSFFSVSSIQIQELRDWKILALLLILGVANGYGVTRYAVQLSTPGTPMAAFAVAVSITMVVIAPILEYLVSGKGVSMSHVFGYLLAGGAIYFLGR